MVFFTEWRDLLAGLLSWIRAIVGISKVMNRFYLVAASIGFAAQVAEAEDGAIQFNRDVRPILSDKCFKCHGPDAKNQKSDFRVDTFEEATRSHGDFTGVVPGSLEKSSLHERIHATDRSEVMPPPKTKLSLTPEEKSILDQWILQGAPYEKHWSLIDLPESVTIPRVRKAASPIDAFIWEALEKKKMRPSPEASPEKWLRRVTFDLTGLPPSLEELDAFLRDPSRDAREKVADRLLQSTEYAERMTAEWLDVARYSDTYGYQVDRNREVWPWRDWVIGAFQKNMPYDQFITEQIAGDLLPNASPDQVLATAFNRLHGQKVEGGSVEEEFRIEYIADRVHTFGTAFLGLTLECSRCHDHKYDPVTMRDYYSLSAFFANIDEAGLYSFFTPSVPTPTLELPSEQQSAQLQAANLEVEKIELELGKLYKEAEAKFSRPESVPPANQEKPGLRVWLDFESVENNKIPNRVDEKSPASTSPKNIVVPGKTGKGLKMTGDDAVNLPKGVGNFSRDQAFSFALWINTPDKKKRAVIVRRSKAWTDAASRGYELLLEDGKLSAALVHFWPGNAIRRQTRLAVPLRSWQHVAVSYDGSSRVEGLKIYINGLLAETEAVKDSLSREIAGGGDDFVGLGQRMRDNGFKNGLVDEFHLYDREITAPEVRKLFDAKESFTEAERREIYLRAFWEPAIEKREQLRKAREKRSAIQKSIKEIMVMRDLPPGTRRSYVLGRGMYDSREEEVIAGTPKALPALQSSNDQPNRLDLAAWLTSPNHPLAARVAVNRYWQMMFGRGLVSTPEDFGSQGNLPTHPEFLDWLARDLIEHGWDLHHFFKQIVLSKTYSQSAVVTSEMRERDPDNIWLARSPSYKLSAEMIRDNALAVSGLLVEKVGGPSVRPYDLAVSFKPIKPDKGENLYRRSIYTFWKRTGPSPIMMTLDSSKKDVCRVVREETASPLQSLVLLNSPQFVEASRVAAENLLAKHRNNDRQIIVEGFRLFTSRRPDQEELKILEGLLSEQIALFAENPEGAAKYFETGDKTPLQDGDKARLAGVTVLISALMNFDESITKR